VTDTVETPSRRWSALPRWARIGILVLAAVIVALIAIVAVRLATRVPPIALGVTSIDDLRPGSCLAEDALDLTEYTVVACGTEHPQQAFAPADVQLDDSVYALVDDSLATFGDQVCLRFLEYRLFLREGLETGDYEAHAIAMPDAAAYADGDTEGLCVISRRDGEPITGDLYRPMP
jgi:hypothetical protein